MLKGLHFVRSRRRRNGLSRWYVYAWRGGPVIAHFDCERKPSLSPRELRQVLKELEQKRGVDPTTRSAILDVTLRQYQEDAIMVFATHMIADVEAVFDSVIFLGYGELKLFEDVDLVRE